MPRKARIDAPGALHHIIVRGIEHTNIFRTNSDRNDFVNRFGKLVNETKSRCFAWALLSNHFHLLVKTGNVPVTTLMRRLLTGIDNSQIFLPGKEQNRVTARSLYCYFAVRELGVSMSELSRKIGLSVSGISLSVKRGEKLADDAGFCLVDV